MGKVTIGGVPEHFNLPWHLAIENGFFSKEDIDLNFQICKGGTGQMCKMLEDGDLDMAVLLTEGAVKHIIEKNKFKIVQVYINTPLVWGVHTGYNSDLSNYNQAFEASFAISRYGSGSHLMPQVDAHFKQKNIGDSQWKVIKNLDGALEALQHKEDLVFYWEKFTTKPYVDSKQLKRIGEFITPWPCFVIVANNHFIQDSFGDIQKLLKVINYTAHQLMDATNAIDMFIERYNMLPADAHQWFYMTEWNTESAISPKMLNNVMQILLDCGVIQNKIPYSQLVFNP